MTTMFKASELAAMRLPGLPTTARAILRRAKREEWPTTLRTGRGGPARYYLVSALPREAQVALTGRDPAASETLLVNEFMQTFKELTVAAAALRAQFEATMGAIGRYDTSLRNLRTLVTALHAKARKGGA